MANGGTSEKAARYRVLGIPAALESHSFKRFPTNNPTADNDAEAKAAHRSALYGLSRVNFFIGTNNSGKSRLLRALLTDVGQSRAILDGSAIRTFETAQERALQRSLSMAPPGHDDDQTTTLMRLYQAIAACPHLMKTSRETIARIDTLANRIRQRLPVHWDPDHDRLLSECQNATESLVNYLNHRGSSSTSSTDIPESFSLYIPALRTLRRVNETEGIKQNVSDGSFDKVPPLRHSIISAYFRAGLANGNRLDPSQVEFDQVNAFDCFTGEEFNELLIRHLLGNLSQRNRIREYLEFLSPWFFQGAPVDIIPDRDERLVKIKIGDEREELIHHLGDGLQQIILLTAPFFFIPTSRSMRLFVEEPELYLHAGQQAALVSAWSHLCGDDHQVFATTHSNHFLDRTADTDSISVYSFSKSLPAGLGNEKQAEISIQLWTHDDLTILSSLGVRSSSVLLTNATIWVEGITDRMYVRRLLEILQAGTAEGNRLREGTHFSFVEYGGAAITHWSFTGDRDRYGIPTIDVIRLCSKLFVITDEIPDRGGGDRRRSELERRLGDRFHELECREIENLVSPGILNRTVKELTGCDMALSDDDYASYKAVGLGFFLQRKLARKGPKAKLWPKGPLKENSPIVSTYKVSFAEVACNFMVTRDDLTLEAIKIGTKLLKFIRRQNTVS